MGSGQAHHIEFLPAVWFYSDNTDFVGKTMQTEPMYHLEGHLTRDFMERLWGSLDVISYPVAKLQLMVWKAQH
jgi:hypothetical protein